MINMMIQMCESLACGSSYGYLDAGLANKWPIMSYIGNQQQYIRERSQCSCNDFQWQTFLRTNRAVFSNAN